MPGKRRAALPRGTIPRFCPAQGTIPGSRRLLAVGTTLAVARDMPSPRTGEKRHRAASGRRRQTAFPQIMLRMVRSHEAANPGFSPFRPKRTGRHLAARPFWSEWRDLPAFSPCGRRRKSRDSPRIRNSRPHRCAPACGKTKNTSGLRCVRRQRSEWRDLPAFSPCVRRRKLRYSPVFALVHASHIGGLRT